MAGNMSQLPIMTSQGLKECSTFDVIQIGSSEIQMLKMLNLEAGTHHAEGLVIKIEIKIRH
jgi:hypothetical protein